MKMDNHGFIAVHVGAGKYSTKMIPQYEKLCRVACKKGIEMLNSGGNSLDAVTIATAILEDSDLTNAGYGSNLTIDGKVECDASIMNGNDLNFGAVGAVAGVKNPIILAKKICCGQNEQMELGRIPPCVVVGSGAYNLAQKYSDVRTVFPESLITRNAVKLHNRYKNQLLHYKNQSINLECDRLDTVGAIAIDQTGKTAAACSSGGILLKQSGRIGQAAMYGCGCWAQDKIHSDNFGVAVTTSGCGEHIMKTVLAREIATGMIKSTAIPCMSLNENIHKLFLDSSSLKNIDSKLCGLLVLKCNDNDCEFMWAHTTPSMCIGYMSTTSSSAKSRISNLPSTAQPGKSVLVEGMLV